MFKIKYEIHNAELCMYSYVDHKLYLYCKKHEDETVEIETFEIDDRVNLVDHEAPFSLKNQPVTEALPSLECGISNLKCKCSLTYF